MPRVALVQQESSMHSDRRDGGVVECKPVVICGSGPSLSQRLLAFDALDIPIVAVSTAVRVIRRPDYWALLDDINHHHGGQKAYEVARDPAVCKVVPATRKYFWDKFPNLECVNIYSINHRARDKARTKREYFDGGDGVLRAFNRSMPFAIQWAFHHFNCAIFCGMDLRSDLKQPYVYAEAMKSNQVNTQNGNHRKELAQIKAWSKLALAAGYVWLNWNPPESPMATACHGEFDGRERLSSVFAAAVGEAPSVVAGS